jgi:hypothetical protein
MTEPLSNDNTFSDDTDAVTAAGYHERMSEIAEEEILLITDISPEELILWLDANSNPWD